MFEDLHNTTDDHWSASSGVAPPEASLPYDNARINIDDEDEANNDDDSEPEAVTPTNVRGKRGGGPINNKGKKPKTNTGHWLKEQMGKIVEMNERTTASCESIARREDRSGVFHNDGMTLWKMVVLLQEQMNISLQLHFSPRGLRERCL